MRSFWVRLLIVVCLILAGVAGYYWMHPQKQPAWLAGTPLARSPQSTTLYEWKDASGTTHITDKPPASGSYQVKTYRSDQSVLPLPPALKNN